VDNIVEGWAQGCDGMMRERTSWKEWRW